MIDRFATDVHIWIAYRPKLVLLVLKQVGVDRSRAHSIFCYKAFHFWRIVHASRQVPKNMERHARCGAGQGSYLRCVRKFLFECSGRACLQKLAEPRARVCKSPGRYLDNKLVHAIQDPLEAVIDMHLPLSGTHLPKQAGVYLSNSYFSIEILF